MRTTKGWKPLQIKDPNSPKKAPYGDPATDPVPRPASKESYSKPPNRYWIRGDNGLWSSVARNSAAHLEEEDLRLWERRGRARA